MCGRYSALTEDQITEVRSIIRGVSIRLVRDDMESPPPGEIRPTDRAPVVTKSGGGFAFESAKFGFKRWDGKGVILNARAETVKEKGIFSKYLESGRCVVPAGEYYEWREKAGPAEKTKPKKKIKHFIKDREGSLLFFAGLYRDGDDGMEFVIITKAASGAVAEIHDRMPVILRINQLEPWLSGELNVGDIINTDFNDTAVALCEDGENDGDVIQLSLFPE